MNIIKPSVEFVGDVDGRKALEHLEKCGRVCYKSENLIKENSCEKFLANVIARGHEAVLEHYSFTVRFICDRGVSHEIVRHRLASFCQESSRYCNYSKDKFGNELTFIKPCFWDKDSVHYRVWMEFNRLVEENYMEMIEHGCTPEEARSILPNSLKTEVMMTANIREWRHFLKLRTSPAAHPQMREVALMLLEKCKETFPVLFDDIEVSE